MFLHTWFLTVSIVKDITDQIEPLRWSKVAGLSCRRYQGIPGAHVKSQKDVLLGPFRFLRVHVQWTKGISEEMCLATLSYSVCIYTIQICVYIYIYNIIYPKILKETSFLVSYHFISTNLHHHYHSFPPAPAIPKHLANGPSETSERAVQRRLPVADPNRHKRWNHFR